MAGSATEARLSRHSRSRQQRKRAELTLEALAEKAELHPNYLGRVERGEEHVSLIALRRLAAALKLRVRDLVAEI